MTRRGAAAVLLLVAGCDRQTPTPQPTPRAAPAALVRAPAAATSDTLSAYAGHYPFDKLGGRSFLEHPAVRRAIAASGADADALGFIRTADGPATPIEERDGRLRAWGCEAHNCGGHDWAVLIATDGSAAEVCHADADSGGRPRWFANGALEDKTESCD